ncbi:unnamed protein product [Penicillium salamii]|nr:unnamed protein product [Penicillium salamii]
MLVVLSALLSLLPNHSTTSPPHSFINFLRPGSLLSPYTHIIFQPLKMCYKVVERYSVCKCLYFEHSIDPCQAYGQRGHTVQEKTVLVGYACDRHSRSSGGPRRSDSGYSSEKGSCR